MAGKVAVLCRSPLRDLTTCVASGADIAIVGSPPIEPLPANAPAPSARPCSRSPSGGADRPSAAGSGEVGAELSRVLVPRVAVLDQGVQDDGVEVGAEAGLVCRRRLWRLTHMLVGDRDR